LSLRNHTAEAGAILDCVGADPMTIEQIRKRHDFEDGSGGYQRCRQSDREYARAHADRAALLAHIDALSTQNPQGDTAHHGNFQAAPEAGIGVGSESLPPVDALYIEQIKPLTAQELTEVRARNEEDERDADRTREQMFDAAIQCFDDRAALLSHIDALSRIGR